MKRLSNRARNLVQYVVSSLIVSKKRTIFAITAMMTVIAVVTALAGLGYGVEQALERQMDALGADLLLIEAVRTGSTRGGRVPVLPVAYEKLDEIRTWPNVSLVAWMHGIWIDVTVDDQVYWTHITIADRDWFAIRRAIIETGQEPDGALEDKSEYPIWLGPVTAYAWFGNTDPIGKHMDINGETFEVVGLLAPRGLDSFGDDLDEVAIVPHEALSAFPSVFGPTHIYITVDQVDMLDSTKAHINEAFISLLDLDTDKTSTYDYKIVDQAQLLAARLDISDSMRELIIAAVILLLAAGIASIAMVMLGSIRERTSEIGLLRAVGASKGHIYRQVLCESAILGGFGGLLGALIGIALSVLIATARSLSVVIAWPVLAMAIVLSVCIGVIGGWVPAIRAASVDPIKALHE